MLTLASNCLCVHSRPERLRGKCQCNRLRLLIIFSFWQQLLPEGSWEVISKQALSSKHRRSFLTQCEKMQQLKVTERFQGYLWLRHWSACSAFKTLPWIMKRGILENCFCILFIISVWKDWRKYLYYFLQNDIVQDMSEKLQHVSVINMTTHLLA